MHVRDIRSKRTDEQVLKEQNQHRQQTAKKSQDHPYA